MYSVPRSIPRTAEAAEAVEANRKSNEIKIVRLESRRLPCGGICGNERTNELGLRKRVSQVSV